MVIDLATLERMMIEWLVEWGEGEIPTDLDANADLLSSAAIDSMAFTGLIAFAEGESGLEFDFEDFDIDDGVSVHRIASVFVTDGARSSIP